MAESRLAAIPAKEMILNSLLSVAEQHFDVILIDVAPSISHIQSCAFAYTRKLIIPVGMDNLSIGGALSSLQTMDWLNKMLQLGCGCVGFLPTMLDHRLSATEVVLHNLGEMARERDRHAARHPDGPGATGPCVPASFCKTSTSGPRRSKITARYARSC